VIVADGNVDQQRVGEFAAEALLSGQMRGCELFVAPDLTAVDRTTNTRRSHMTTHSEWL